MRKSNLRSRLRVFILGIVFVIPLTSRLVGAEQQNRPMLDKDALIVTMKKIREANQLEVSQIEVILASLDRLSEADRRDTVMHRELHELSTLFLFDESSEPAKQLMFRKLAFLHDVGHV